MYGVDPSQWQVSVLRGAGQSVPASGTLATVTVLATDLNGNPLQGAPVDLHQRVLAWEGACLSAGPCASAPVLASSQAMEVSGVDGTLNVTPLQVPNAPQTAELAASTGTQGFVTWTLIKTPDFQ